MLKVYQADEQILTISACLVLGRVHTGRRRSVSHPNKLQLPQLEWFMTD